MAREVWVEMSRVLGFATDWLRSNVRVILQYRVNELVSRIDLEDFLPRPSLDSQQLCEFLPQEIESTECKNELSDFPLIKKYTLTKTKFLILIKNL